MDVLVLERTQRVCSTLLIMGGGQNEPCDIKWNKITDAMATWYCLSHDKHLKFQFKINKERKIATKQGKTETWLNLFPSTHVTKVYLTQKF